MLPRQSERSPPALEAPHADSRTTWSSLIFAFARPGIVQIRASRSISHHNARRTSQSRLAVNRTASFTASEQARRRASRTRRPGSAHDPAHSAWTCLHYAMSFRYGLGKRPTLCGTETSVSQCLFDPVRRESSTTTRQIRRQPPGGDVISIWLGETPYAVWDRNVCVRESQPSDAASVGFPAGVGRDRVCQRILHEPLPGDPTDPWTGNACVLDSP